LGWYCASICPEELKPAYLKSAAQREREEEDARAAEAELEAIAREREQIEQAIEQERLKIKSVMAWLRFKRAWFLSYLQQQKAYNPDHPRVPAGNPDGGGWMSDGADGGRIRLASSEKPRFGPAAVARIAAETAQRLIEAYRSQNGLRDLLGRNPGTIAVTTLNGMQI
jgi:hypothetical protein